VSLDLAPNRPVLWQHEQARDERCIPAETLAGDGRREPRLRIMAAERFLDRGQLGLHLHDEQGPRSRVERQGVDRAAFAEGGERDLGLRAPTWTVELRHEASSKCRVPPIQQTVDLTAAPSNADHDVGVVDREDRSKSTDRHALDPATLQA
jgi:hypothetical protein